MGATLSFKIVPLELKEANKLVLELHRHHKPAQGHRFSIGLKDVETGEIVGAAIVGRPVARLVDSKKVLEVTRCVTNGAKNACSALLGAVARIGNELGYEKVQTYTLPEEGGVSLKGAGWVLEKENAGGGQWKHTDGKARRTDQPISPKSRWAKYLKAYKEALDNV